MKIFAFREETNGSLYRDARFSEFLGNLCGSYSERLIALPAAATEKRATD
jgi:hypothetical protein